MSRLPPLSIDDRTPEKKRKDERKRVKAALKKAEELKRTQITLEKAAADAKAEVERPT